MAEFRFPPTINYFGSEGDTSLVDVLQGLDKNTEGSSVHISSEFDIKEVAFGFSTSSPMAVAVVREGERVKKVKLKITIPFNSPATTLTMGHAGSQDALMRANQNIPGFAQTYEVSPELIYGGVDTVKLYINRAGATEGSGVVFIETERNDL